MPGQPLGVSDIFPRVMRQRETALKIGGMSVLKFRLLAMRRQLLNGEQPQRFQQPVARRLARLRHHQGFLDQPAQRIQDHPFIGIGGDKIIAVAAGQNRGGGLGRKPAGEHP